MKVSLSEFHILALFLFHHITHTVSLSLSLTIKQTLWYLYLSFLIGTHQKCSIYSLQWYNLFSFSTNTLHSHSIFRSLSWYIPCMHSTLIGLFPISHFCASLSLSPIPYPALTYIHTYFLSQYFFPLANLSPCPPPTTFPHVSVNVSETRISNYILLIFCSVKNHLFTVLKSAITFFRLIFVLSSLNDDTNRPTHLSKLNSMS